MPTTFTVSSQPIEELKRKARKAEVNLSNQATQLLEVLGIQLLSFVKLAYNEKARGGVGSDGIVWQDNKPATKKAKNRRGKSRSSRTGPRSRKGSTSRPSAGSVEIGVDTGLQRASATPGFKAPDGDGGNILEIVDLEVIVGFARSYSVFFDETRPLLPTVLPVPWTEALDGLTTQWAEHQLEELE